MTMLMPIYYMEQLYYGAMQGFYQNKWYNEGAVQRSNVVSM